VTEREQLRIDIKKRLNSYRELQAEHRQLQEELLHLEVLMSSPGAPNMDGMPRAPGVCNPVEKLVVKKVTLQERYNARIAQMLEQQEAIEDMIDTLEPTERRLARFRYIDGMDWETVCVMMCYSWRQTHRIHGRMLDRLVDAEMKKRETSE
jgi:DNA-directed RNA polymerase specialized sigma24 family protein